MKDYTGYEGGSTIIELFAKTIWIKCQWGNVQDWSGVLRYLFAAFCYDKTFIESFCICVKRFIILAW